MYTQTPKKIIVAIIPIIGIIFSCSIASAFDSGCKHGNEECAAGPEAARGDWHQSLEHQYVHQHL